MSVYIGVVGPDLVDIDALTSVLQMKRRDEDSFPYFIKATKGYEARQKHINKFLESDHDAILLLDGDMIFPDDALERLRAHDVPFVSGLYLRRAFSPLGPVWFEPFTGGWPYMPMMTDPERGKLHPIGASGWGCILIHRDVITSVRSVLCGEQEVLEDDMDVWPYDLQDVISGRERIQVLRGEKDPVGSDIRFPFYALHCGYQLWGDPDVRPAHLLNYPLVPDDFTHSSPEARDKNHQTSLEYVTKKRVEWVNHIAGLGGEQ
jgi:hypothetical protein